MTTVSKILLDARALLDELTDKGVQISDSDVSDLMAKGVRFVDMAQKELYSTGNLFEKFEFTQKNPDNLLGKTLFEIKEFKGTDIIPDEVGKVARAYYFEADEEGSVIVEEFEGGTWQTLLTIPTTTSTSMVQYKGLITPTTTGNLIRYRFTGTTYYKIQNYALFSEPFKASKIPDFRPWVKYTMPTNFRLTDAVIEEFKDRQYIRSSNAKWEGYNELWVNYFFEGTMRVVYKPVPITITLQTQNLQLDDISVNAITYYGAGKLAAHDYPELVNYFEGKYNEILLKSVMKNPASEQAIIDVYGGNYGNV